jgi:hypothetical protein
LTSAGKDSSSLYIGITMEYFTVSTGFIAPSHIEGPGRNPAYVMRNRLSRTIR